MADDGRKRHRLGLASFILIGLGLGVASGLFFGEYCASLSIIGDAYVRLLQMTVLPYIIATLIVHIGGLTVEEAKQLGMRAGGLLLVFWAIGLLFVPLLTLTFPDWTSSSFFSTSLVEPPKAVDVLGLYIPANVFNSMANNLVPAVVLFSIATGIALIGVEKKAGLLDTLASVERSLGKINLFIVKFTPVGVFAIAASALGTMNFAAFGRLQAYVIAYIVGAVVLGGWVLPMLVAALTPFKYRDIVVATRAAMLTAFMVNNLFIVLPMLGQAASKLLDSADLRDPDAKATVGVVLPSAFAFPTMGKLLTLIFVPFAAWYIGEPMAVSQFPKLLGSGLATYFAGTSVALPLLLDSMELPSDVFQLYLLSSIFTERFGTALSAMHLLTFTLLATAVMTGVVRVGWKRVGVLVGGTAVLTIIALPVSEAYLSVALRGAYKKDQVIRSMQTLLDPVPATMHRERPASFEPPAAGVPRLRWILDRGSIRVGYLESRLPFSYFNDDDKLVGFDIDMAHRLARELSVTIEFIPLAEKGLAVGQLQTGELDIVMAAIPATTDLLIKTRFSKPYLDLTYALLVLDHRRREFTTYEAIGRIEKLRVGAIRLQYFRDLAEEMFPTAEVVTLNSLPEFVEQGEEQEIDAVLTTAEDGSAWSLLYPEYGVVIPKPDIVRLPLAYPVPHDEQWADFVSAWIDLKQKDLTIEKIYDHWILGLTAEAGKTHWSVIRDVLHWVD